MSQIVVVLLYLFVCAMFVFLILFAYYERNKALSLNKIVDYKKNDSDHKKKDTKIFTDLLSEIRETKGYLKKIFEAKI